MFKEYLVKRASLMSALVTHPFDQKVVPDVWDSSKQETIDQLLASLPPIHRRAPLAAGTARLTNRSIQ